MNVKHIAEQVVAALHEGADFSDLDEFLYERSMVEKGRDECEHGKVLSNADVLWRRKAATPGPPWAEHAAAALREALEVAKKTASPASQPFARRCAKPPSAWWMAPRRGSPCPRWGTPRFFPAQWDPKLGIHVT